MIDIFEGALAEKIIDYLRQLNLLSVDEVRMIDTTRSDFQVLMIIKLMAENIYNGDKKEFMAFAKFMESHWALKFLFQYWQNKC